MDLSNVPFSAVFGLGGIAATFILMKYRVDKLEENRKDDEAKRETERKESAKNLQSTISELSLRIADVDQRMRQHTGNQYEAIDAIRSAGAILENEVNALKVSFDPTTLRDFQKQWGETLARLQRAEQDIRCIARKQDKRSEIKELGQEISKIVTSRDVKRKS